MEWIEHLLSHTAEGLRLFLEILSVLSVAVGLIAVLAQVVHCVYEPFRLGFCNVDL